MIAVQKNLTIKLDDKTTGANQRTLFSITVLSFKIFLGELFAEAPVDQYPGIAVEQVLDSSRYFVLQIKDRKSVV